MLDVTYRRGDVVRFRRGSNEYVGTVTKVSSVLTALFVRPTTVDAVWRIGHKHVERLEKPVVTEKERAALHALAAEHLAARPREAVTVRQLRDAGPGVSATTLRGLFQRGLVKAAHSTVSSASGPLLWSLTEEGMRVARSLLD